MLGIGIIVLQDFFDVGLCVFEPTGFRNISAANQILLKVFLSKIEELPHSLNVLLVTSGEFNSSFVVAQISSLFLGLSFLLGLCDVRKLLVRLRLHRLLHKSVVLLLLVLM